MEQNYATFENYLLLYEPNGIQINGNDKFKLDSEFLLLFEGKQPQWDVLGYFTYKRTYSRFDDVLNRSEEFYDTVKRVVEGTFDIHKNYCLKNNIYWNETIAQQMAQTMFVKMWNFKFLPSGRGLWMMGTPFIQKNGNTALMNCSFVSTENLDIKGSKIFEKVMDSLMQGVGVGFDTSGANKVLIKEPHGESFVFVIPDSRQGWTDGLCLLLNAFFNCTALPIFDYSKLRKKGERIKGFGGISSGFEPLRDSYDAIKKLLSDRIGKRLSSVDIIDIMDYIAKCVVAGNVRRSALICIGDYNDDEFMASKDDKDAVMDRRWASNHSVNGKIGMNYKSLVDHLLKNGEPAVLWLDNARNYSRMNGLPDFKDINVKGVNPCAEQSLDSDEFCNLVETFPSHHANYEEFKETLFYAYFYGKTVTLIDNKYEDSDKIMKKNRRLGISQSGIIDAFNLHGRAEMLKWSDNGYNYLRVIDKEYSKRLKIPESIKITSIKPSGTVSLLAGVSAGIHYPISKYYIRRERISDTSELIETMKNAGYTVEKDLYSPNTVVIEFPVEAKNFQRSVYEVSVWEQVANAIDEQRFWADNQVSITATFKKEEEKDLPHLLEFCEDKIKGISLLSLCTDFYKQMPYEQITKEKYEEMKKKLKPIQGLNTTVDCEGDNYCSGGFCKVQR